MVSLDFVLMNWYRELREEILDVELVHVFPFWKIAIEHDYNKFKEVINYLLGNLKKICKRGVKDLEKLKWNMDHGMCFCGSKVTTSITKLISEKFGETIHSRYVCLGYALMNILKDKTYVVITYPKIEMKGFIDLLPKNVNTSILVKEGKTNIKLNDVIETVKKTQYKIIFIASAKGKRRQYNTYLLDKIKIESVLKIVRHEKGKEIEYIF